MVYRRLLPLLVLVVALGAWNGRDLSACPFCSEERGPTLVGDFAQASMVLLGKFTNPKLGEGGFGEGTSDFVIETVLKDHPAVKGKKFITLPRYVTETKNKYLLYCDVYKDNIDPYRGIVIESGSELVRYLQGAVKLKDAAAPERLRYCFDFLNSLEIDVALDAYREFAKADYKEYMGIAKKLPPEVIAGWLKDPKTPPYRYGLYASLLGHCGKTEHGQLLRSMIEDPQKRMGSGLDGMLAGYIMIQPTEGWTYVKSILNDPKQDFLFRYSALRTVRFLWDQRPDLVNKKDLVHGLLLILDHADMADFAVEDLRKWKCWDETGKVLGLFGVKSHDIPVVRRAILRYALQSPHADAVAFVRAQRQRDAQWVQETEELLKLEP